LKLEPGEL